MVLYEKILFKGNVGSKELDTPFDSGATISCVRPDIAILLGQPQKLPDPIRLQTADEGNIMSVDRSLYLDFYLHDLRMFDDFFLVPNMSEEVIVGATTLQKWRIKLDFEHDKIVTDPRVARMQLVYLKFRL